MPESSVDPNQVEVRRSARRRRTVSAYRDGSRTVVLVPARLSRAEEQVWVERMVARLDASERRRRPSDTDLAARAETLSARYLGGRARPSSVRWVDNQRGRWGSCTPADRSIRLSSRLRGLPSYVVDYVLLHELAHLVEPTHGPQFWALLEGFGATERARGYLDGYAAAAAGAAADGAAADGAPADGAPTDGAPTDGAPADGADADDVEGGQRLFC